VTSWASAARAEREHSRALDTGATMAQETEEVRHVAMTIDGDHHDRRIEAILTDPKGYFERARRRAEAKVRREMEQERDTKPGPRTII